MNILKKMRGEKPPQMVEVEITRAIMVKLPDGTLTSAEPGQVLTLEKHEADSLVGSRGAERILSEADKAELERIGKLIPPPHDPRPVPEAWGDLPECFGKWWGLAERLRAMKGRLTEMEVVLLRGHRLSEEEQHWLRHDAGVERSTYRQRQELIDGWMQKHSGRMQVLSEQKAADMGRVRDAARRQGEAIQEFLDEHLEAMLALKFECSKHVLAANARLQRLSSELADTGFEVFKARVAALGVGDALIREWFGKSADFLKFNQPVATPDGVRYGWTEESGERVNYVDRPVEGMAAILPRYQAEEARLGKLLKQAKAELKQAKAAGGEELQLPS